MDSRIYGNYFIGKIVDKFYIFHIRASLGGVSFSTESDAFHTVEDAHLWLLENCKENSTPETTLLLVEVQKEYMLIGQENDIEQKELS